MLGSLPILLKKTRAMTTTTEAPANMAINGRRLFFSVLRTVAFLAARLSSEDFMRLWDAFFDMVTSSSTLISGSSIRIYFRITGVVM